MDVEDLLAYADDILILFHTEADLAQGIEKMMKWSKDMGLLINSKKSGIVEFLPRRHRPTLEVGSSISQIPVMNSYKYLGLILN